MHTGNWCWTSTPVWKNHRAARTTCRERSTRKAESESSMSSQSQSAPSSSRLPPLGFVLLAGLSLFWGLNWPGMKIIMAELPAWWFRTSCALVGGASLLAISAASGNSVRITRRELPMVVLCSAFSFVGWLVFSAYGRNQ